jgi:hypothetical protein
LKGEREEGVCDIFLIPSGSGYNYLPTCYQRGVAQVEFYGGLKIDPGVDFAYV